MYRLFLAISLAIFFCGSLDAKDKKFKPAVITRTDGLIIECVARYPKGFRAREIEYKTEKNSKKIHKIKSDDVRTIQYYLDDERWVELDRYPYIPIANVIKGSQKQNRPIFLNVSERGPTTLYLNLTIRNGAVYRDYYCKRDEESVASQIMMGKGIQGKTIQTVGGGYFSDNLDISEKMKNDVFARSSFVQITGNKSVKLDLVKYKKLQPKKWYMNSLTKNWVKK